ncbi:hypothetical protein DFP72DRAFT_1150249 [Ephemerocybe angulata]|uniref:CBM1 domain-containing protein n=1 Tax=Ephemerocybe angulata TaxID=980116 RepID=A0A8H6LWW5_9AGAR|nr:hypothetical protein DFP72DRAFT_1150249 [Tulosesus angulatus]
MVRIFHVGVGLSSFQATMVASQVANVAIVTGECPKFGFAGGYIQGGGHGPLALYYGMAADQALSYEVITASGEYLTVNADTNPDLRPFAVLVLSITIKAFPETPSAGLVLSLNTNNNQVHFWRGFSAFYNLSSRWVENSMFMYYELFGASLNIRPFVDNGGRAAAVRPAPDFGHLVHVDDHRVHDILRSVYGTLPGESAGVTSLVGGRVFTKTDINANGNAIIDAMRRSGAGFVGHIVGPGHAGPVDNAIHPAWRDAASFRLASDYHHDHKHEFNRCDEHGDYAYDHKHEFNRCDEHGDYAYDDDEYTGGPLETMYGQCGGTGWTGPTEYAPPATCKPVSAPYYSQIVSALLAQALHVQPNILSDQQYMYINVTNALALCFCRNVIKDVSPPHLSSTAPPLRQSELRSDCHTLYSGSNAGMVTRLLQFRTSTTMDWLLFLI